MTSSSKYYIGIHCNSLKKFFQWVDKFWVFNFKNAIKTSFSYSKKIYKNHSNLYLMQNSFLDVYVLESLQGSHIWAHYLLLILKMTVLVYNLCGQKQHLFPCVHFRASVNGNYSYLMHLVIVIVQPLFKSNILAFYSCSVSAYCSYYLEVHCCATCVKIYVGVCGVKTSFASPTSVILLWLLKVGVGAILYHLLLK